MQAVSEKWMVPLLLQFDAVHWHALRTPQEQTARRRNGGIALPTVIARQSGYHVNGQCDHWYIVTCIEVLQVIQWNAGVRRLSATAYQTTHASFTGNPQLSTYSSTPICQSLADESSRGRESRSLQYLMLQPSLPVRLSHFNPIDLTWMKPNAEWWRVKGVDVWAKKEISHR